MDFMTAVKTCLTTKYATFFGRALRSEYWFFFLFGIIATLIATVIDTQIIGYEWDEYGPLYWITFIILFVPSLAAGARRLHDINRSGWWQLLYLIPIIGWIILIVWLATKGEDIDNRFGPPPKPVTEG